MKVEGSGRRPSGLGMRARWKAVDRDFKEVRDMKAKRMSELSDEMLEIRS